MGKTLAKIEVAAKSAGGNPVCEVAVGRRDKPHGRAAGAAVAHPLEGRVLQGSEEFDLQCQRNLLDVIEK